MGRKDHLTLEKEGAIYRIYETRNPTVNQQGMQLQALNQQKEPNAGTKYDFTGENGKMSESYSSVLR